MKLSDHSKEKWETVIKKEIVGLFDNDTFDTNERALPADEVIPGSCGKSLIFSHNLEIIRSYQRKMGNRNQKGNCRVI